MMTIPLKTIRNCTVLGRHRVSFIGAPSLDASNSSEGGCWSDAVELRLVLCSGIDSTFDDNIAWALAQDC